MAGKRQLLTSSGTAKDKKRTRPKDKGIQSSDLEKKRKAAVLPIIAVHKKAIRRKGNLEPKRQIGSGKIPSIPSQLGGPLPHDHKEKKKLQH